MFTMKSLFLAPAHAIPHKKVEETGSRAIDTGFSGRHSSNRFAYSSISKPRSGLMEYCIL